MPSPRRALASVPAIRSLAALLLVAIACGPSIEEEDPIPEHRIEPCESWCSMMFDPVCPAQEVEVPTEEECVQGCSEEDGIWAPVDGVDECEATYVPYVECLASLPCDELQGHFEAINSLEDVPAAEWSSCGTLARAQLDCQSATPEPATASTARPPTRAGWPPLSEPPRDSLTPEHRADPSNPRIRRTRPRNPVPPLATPPRPTL